MAVLYVVFPVFFVISVGYLFATVKKIDLSPVIEILLYLTIPALVISSLAKKRLVVDDLLVVTLAAWGVVLGTGLITLVFLHVTGRQGMRGIYLSTMFMNSGNMGFPLALLAFGTDGLTVAVLYFIAVSLMVYSLGIYIAKGKGGLSEIFKLPLIYAALTGIGISLLDVELPTPLLSALDMLGSATIPLMQISLGYHIHATRFAYPGLSIACSILRIGGGLLIALLIVTLFGIEGLNRNVILLLSAMPSAVINFVMSYRYNLQSELVASTVATSTFMSIITTPLVLFWLMD